MVVDTPGIGAAAVRRLIDAYAAGATAVVATYDGAPRNPVLLAREHFAEVSALAVSDVGARAFLAARPDVVTHVECSDVADPADIDTPDDMRRGGLRDADREPSQGCQLTPGSMRRPPLSQWPVSEPS